MAMPDHGLILVAIDTPPTAPREIARQRVRTALRTILAPLLGCPPEAVPLRTAPGQAPQLAQDNRIGLSISHEPGLSLLAVRRDGAVGIDLVRISAIPDRLAVARDYLGPRQAAYLATLPETEQAAAFARAWSAHEAGLKCLGLALVEWSPASEARLAGCRYAEIDLPAPWMASVAWPQS